MIDSFEDSVGKEEINLAVRRPRTSSESEAIPFKTFVLLGIFFGFIFAVFIYIACNRTSKQNSFRKKQKF